MSFIAALLTFLFFCHPTLLAFGVFVIIMVILFNCCPIVFWLLLLGLVGVVICQLNK